MRLIKSEGNGIRCDGFPGHASWWCRGDTATRRRRRYVRAPNPSEFLTADNLNTLSHSEVFKPLHPPNTLQGNLDPSQILGPIDPTTVKPKAPRPLTADEKRVRAACLPAPPVEACVNLEDFEVLAEKVLSKTAWAYYRSAGESPRFLRGFSGSG